MSNICDNKEAPAGPPSISPARVRSLLNRLGILILLLGLGSAAWIWHAQDIIDLQDAGAQSGQVTPLDSRKHVRDVEIDYGKIGVLVEGAEEFLRGKGLAKTIAVVSIAAATGLFLFSVRLKPE